MVVVQDENAMESSDGMRAPMEIMVGEPLAQVQQVLMADSNQLLAYMVQEVWDIGSKEQTSCRYGSVAKKDNSVLLA